MKRLVGRPRLLAGVLFGLFAIPFVLAAINLAHPKPYVVLDLAQTEIRVRGVFSTHPPLIGLPGRLGIFGVHTGSHPGPLSFYFLAPFYKLFGSTSWALFAGAFAVNLLWIAGAIWLGWRRGGVRLMIGVSACVLLLVHTFGIIVVEQPWNPYLPLMAWTVVLLAAWSVLADDLAMLPVLVLAASYCMQTHVPYLGMGGGVVAATSGGWLVWWIWRRRTDVSSHRLRWLMDSERELPSGRHVLTWFVSSIALGALLWSPPVYEQLRWGSGGNLNLIWNDLAHPPKAAGGIQQGIHLVLAHLDPFQLVRGNRIAFVVLNGNWVGAVFLAIWLVGAVFAWRNRVRLLVLLNTVIGIALVFALVALSKIYDDLYWYLMMWMWTICSAMLASIVWSICVVVSRSKIAVPRKELMQRRAQVVLTVAMVLLFVALNVGAARAEIPDRMLSNQMAHVIPQTIDAIQSGKVPGDTGHGRYLVTWFDAVKIGSAGYTVYDELMGSGIPVGMRPNFWGIVPRGELIPVGQERGVIHLSVGETNIDEWRAKPGVVEVAYYDGRTDAEKVEFAQLRTKARRLIAQAGADPDVVDTSLTAASLNTALPLAATQAMSRMSDIGLPVAMFLGPPGSCIDAIAC